MKIIPQYYAQTINNAATSLRDTSEIYLKFPLCVGTQNLPVAGLCNDLRNIPILFNYS